MVQFLIERYKLSDSAILQAFENIPRHLFVPDNLRRMSYRLSYLPLGEGQVLPEPGLLATILSSLNILPTDTVLIAGTGTPYTAALISTLASELYVIEGKNGQYESGLKQFQALELSNITSFI